MSEKRALAIEEAAVQILTKKSSVKTWAQYSKETLEDQQELYLEMLNGFNELPWKKLSEDAKEYFFQVCVYLAIFRTLLQAKRAGLPPTPISLVN